MSGNFDNKLEADLNGLKENRPDGSPSSSGAEFPSLLGTSYDIVCKNMLLNHSVVHLVKCDVEHGWILLYNSKLNFSWSEALSEHLHGVDAR